MAERRTRLDVALVQRGLAETRERAQSLILAGAVRVNGQPGTRASLALLDSDRLELDRTNTLPFVSRGGLKLEHALKRWPIDVTGRVCLDVGASTGGFTDVLLQRGAARVYAVDVGHGQLHYKLRQDPRVIVMERTNVRTLTALPEQPGFACADVSFISLRVALPSVFALLAEDAPLVTLVKPQFEAGRADVGRGGVVRDAAVHRRVLETIVAWSAAQPRRITDLDCSPLRGPAGNVEFLACWASDGPLATAEAINAALKRAAQSVQGRG